MDCTELPCIPCNGLPCEDCPPPIINNPCIGGEPCDDVPDAKCVVYTGIPLTNIGVSTNLRLEAILGLLNVNHANSGIEIDQSTSVHLSGSGIISDPLIATTQLSQDVDNLISSETDGLLVKFTQANIVNLFSLILGNATLLSAFCELIQGCSSASCGITTNVTAEMI